MVNCQVRHRKNIKSININTLLEQPTSPRRDQRMGPLPPPNLGSLNPVDELGYSPAEPTPTPGTAPARSNSPPGDMTSTSDSLTRKSFSSPQLDLTRGKERNDSLPVERKEKIKEDGTEEDVKMLREMGFSEVNIRKAMKAAKGNAIEAAQLLMEEAKAKLQGLLQQRNSLTVTSSNNENNN